MSPAPTAPLSALSRASRALPCPLCAVRGRPAPVVAARDVLLAADP
ncbi:MAG: hypothetical protein ACOY82_09090 [Pseudomonadota bacterium]